MLLLLPLAAFASSGSFVSPWPLRVRSSVDPLPEACYVTSRQAQGENVNVTVVVIRCEEVNAEGPIAVDWPQGCASVARVEVHQSATTVTVLTAVCVDDPDDPVGPFGPQPSAGPSDGGLIPTEDDLPDACEMTRTVTDTAAVTVTVVVIRCIEVNPDGPVDFAFPEYCNVQHHANEGGPFTITVITAICRDMHIPLTIAELPQQSVSPLPEAPFKLPLHIGPVACTLTQIVTEKSSKFLVRSIVGFLAATLVVALIVAVGLRCMRKSRAGRAGWTRGLDTSLQPVH